MHGMFSLSPSEGESVRVRGIEGNMPIGRSFPLTPALSLAAGERENRKAATVFCRPSHVLLSMTAKDPRTRTIDEDEHDPTALPDFS